jgi:catechol 2,3-dioxygenase-like lactoylglutathione lyase family enzyme
MAAYFRLRHVVLVTDDLERAKRDVPAIFGVQLAFEDPHAKDFEVVNAMFPFGLAFIEVMAPMHEGAPSARFLRNGGGQGGYMVAFNCDDPLRRCEHAQRHGVRLAAEATYDGFVCYQMHPRDCRAAMIEYDRSDGEASVHNRLYAAGGYGWQQAVRMHDTYGIDEVVLQSPDATGLAAHWSMLLERPLTRGADGALGLATDMCSIRFAQAAGGSREWLSGLRLSVRDPAEIVTRARERGYETTRDTVRMLGITFELAAAGGP